MIELVLKTGRDRSVRRRHPWLLSGAVASVNGEEVGVPGAEVRVVSSEGEPLGYGDFSPQSSIRVRLHHFGKQDPSSDWLEQAISRAVVRRTNDPTLADTDAFRIVNGEGDGLPGLVADRYGDAVVVKLTSAGMNLRRERIAAALRAATGLAHGFLRADAVSARREGIAADEGPLWGGPLPESLEIREAGCVFRVDALRGQKTGFYLDQRDNRVLVARLAPGRDVLDLFGYTGSFAVAAARAGAQSVTLVDSSSEAVRGAGRHLEVNAPDTKARCEKGDAFRFIRDGSESYDLLIIDPPPLARRRSDVPKASRAYKDLLLHALRRGRPGALLLAFSCSHHVGPDLFRKIAFGASIDAGRSVQVLGSLGASSDHPVSLDHPEGHYLSGLLLRL